MTTNHTTPGSGNAAPCTAKGNESSCAAACLFIKDLIMKVYIFFRKEGFYPLEFKNDKEAVTNALCNPGTLRVENIDGEVIWNSIKK